MTFRRILCALLLVGLAGCITPYKKADEANRQPLRNAPGDVAFQAFIGRLRAAVRGKDLPMLASLMTGDFGYTEDEAAQPGAHVFTYWDEQQLWPVLEHLLGQKFVPLDLYMVAPAALATDVQYVGPRCGMRLERGSWKFAYFLPQ